jgi:2'-5' RNA ligase superfamily
VPRLVIVLPLQPLTAGDGFTLREWPLHVTVAPTFVVDVDIETVLVAISPLLISQPRLRLRAGPDEGFGRSQSIPVTVVDPSPELNDLHARLKAALTAVGAVFDDPNFVGAGYRAHVTKTRLAHTHPGDVLKLDQAAVVDMAPEGDRRLRRVVWTIPLLNPPTDLTA